MAHIAVSDHDVEITLRLVDEVLSLHGAFHIPLSHISAVSTDPPPPNWFKGVRFGTNIPGVKVAGTFFTDEGTIFYDYHRPDHCITLSLTHETYARVVIEVDEDQDQDALRRAIEKRLTKKP